MPTTVASGKILECCRDDSGENYIQSTFQGYTDRYSCCNTSTDCVDAGNNCYSQGAIVASDRCDSGGIDSAYCICQDKVWTFYCFPTETTCNDNIDNDCDGKINCADPDCAGNPGPNAKVCCQLDTNCKYYEKCETNNECVDARTGQGDCCLNYCECLGAVALYDLNGENSCIKEIDDAGLCKEHMVTTVIEGQCISERPGCLASIQDTCAHKRCIDPLVIC